MKTIVRFSLTIVTITAVVLTGCAPKPTPVPTPAKATPVPVEATPTPPPKEGIALVFWSCWNSGEPHADAFQSLAEGFEKETGIEVDVIFNGRENPTKAVTALSAGTEIDLIDADAFIVAGSLMVEGMGYPLDDLLDKDAWGEPGRPFRDIFFPGALDLYEFEGRTYLIPHTLITIAFWYDKRDFSAAGIEQPPTTWNELLDACEKIEATGIAPLTHDAHDMLAGFWYYHLIERMEGPGYLLSAAEDKTGEMWSEPAFLKAALKERELWDRGYIIEGAEAFAWPQAQMTLAEGAAAMMLHGSWLPNELKASVDPEFEWGGFSFPAVEGGAGKNTDIEAFMMTFMVLKDAPHPREAFDFIRYCLSKENQEFWVETTMNGVPREDVGWPDEISDAGDMFGNATALFQGFDGLPFHHAEYYAMVLAPNHLDMWVGKITPEEFIAKMKADTIAYWETH